MLYLKLLTEKRIRDAIDNDEFDGLAHTGKPLHFADDTFCSE